MDTHVIGIKGGMIRGQGEAEASGDHPSRLPSTGTARLNACLLTTVGRVREIIASAEVYTPNKSSRTGVMLSTSNGATPVSRAATTGFEFVIQKCCRRTAGGRAAAAAAAAVAAPGLAVSTEAGEAPSVNLLQDSFGKTAWVT